jgi:gluconate 2-dehydrogenase alpha chain
MPSAVREADVVIVGLGAAGAVAAYVLTRAGLEVIALEAGPRLDATMMSQDEIRNDIRSWMSPKSKGEVPTWRSSASEQATAPPRSTIMVNAVGGSTVHYDCASYRFLPWNFRSRSLSVERYGPHCIPQGSTLADWPLTYDELEPYYDAVERAIGVSGRAGVVDGRRLDGGNPFEGSRRREYPLPPLRRTGWTELMAAAGRGLGWHPFPSPTAINSMPYQGNDECTYCGFCQSNGCYRNAKGSVDATLIPRAETTGLLTIETEARATSVETDQDGLAREVRYVQDGREQRCRGRVVLIGSFLYENARLLLMSRSKAFPNGLSNNHGQVGRHYMAHLTPFAYGVFPGRRLNRFNGSCGQAVALDDWNGDNFDHAGVGFISGGLFMALQEAKPIAAALDPVPPGVPRWGSGWKAWQKTNAQAVGSVFAQLENLSYENNVLDLDPVVKDPFGTPVIRVTHGVGDMEQRAWDFARERLEEWLRGAGATETWSDPAIMVEPRHPYGGTRTGDDPETSVVDPLGFSHEVPNLGIIGASTFPTSGGHNPTLTLQAVTWRTADHLANSWSSRAATTA